MHTCKICGKEFEKRISLEKHVGSTYGKEKKKRHCPLLVYMWEYEGDQRFSKDNLEKMYLKDLKSTPMIAEELGVMKLTLLSTMHYFRIPMRNTSEATKSQIKRDGLWNKGLTKYDNESIRKCGENRRGKNNPFYTAPGFDERLAKMKIHWHKMHRNSCGNRNPKTTEARMCKILDAHGIQYVRNFCLKTGDSWRLYDFLIEGMLIVEMNGNYYHANPAMYKPTDTIVIANRTKKAADVWLYDDEKRRLAQVCGYAVLTIWEKDFCGMSDAEVVSILRSEI
jgi:hypothetical protein